MKKAFFIASLVIISMHVNAAVIHVAQDGSGDHTMISAALAAAQNGDEIVIADSATYTEDLAAGAGVGLVASFTLRAAEGENPTVRNANQAARLGDLGIPGTDYQGFILLGCQNALVEGIHFENENTTLNANGNTSIMAIADSVGVSVRDCTFRGPGGQGTTYPGDNFLILVSGIENPPSDILIEGCEFREGYIGIVVAKFMPGTPTDPSITVRGCHFEDFANSCLEPDNGASPDNQDPTQATGPGNLFEDCYLTKASNPIDIGGGYHTIRHCTIIDAENNGLNIDHDGPHGTRPISVTVENTNIIGCDNLGIKHEEGTLNVSHTIIAGNGKEGLHLRNIGQKNMATVDHCDFYENDKQEGGAFEVRVDPSTPEPVQLVITNTNIVGYLGVLNGDAEDIGLFDEDGVQMHYCNVFAADLDYINVTPENSLAVEPLYESPSSDPASFAREGFQLKKTSPVLTAGEEGTYIGAVGSGTVSVADWMIF